MPKVHFADPGLQAALGQQRRLLVDDQPGHRKRRPEDVCAARRSRRWPTMSGSGSPLSPNSVEQLVGPGHGVEVEEQRPARGGGVGDERAAQPVHQPGVGGRDHTVGGHVGRAASASSGAEKYGSSTSPVRRGHPLGVSRSGPRTRPRRGGPATRSPVTGAGRCARSHASTVSPWLARATAATGTPASASARRPAVTTESNSASGSCSTPPPRGSAGAAPPRRGGDRDRAVLDRRRSPWCRRCPGRWRGCAESSVRDLPHSEVDLPLSGRNVRLTSTAPPSGRTGIRQQCRGAEKRIAPHGIDHAHYRRAERGRPMGNAQFLLSGWADRSRAGAATLQRCLQARRCT